MESSPCEADVEKGLAVFQRSIRDSGYIDCWDSERSDSLSPPRHGRDDSFDSLDSFGSRSQQTPSPDVVLRGSSDGRGSDSESDLSHRKHPDVKKDDMSARRTSYSEPKSVVPFNQYLPNKNNQTAYIPAPLRKKKAERDDFRKSWSTMSSPLGGERPFSKRHPETIQEEPLPPLGGDFTSSRMTSASPSAKPVQTDMAPKNLLPHFLPRSGNQTAGPQNEKNGSEQIRKLRKLEQAGIKIRPASHRDDGSPKPVGRVNELTRDIVLRRENPFTWCYQPKEADSEEEGGDRIPNLEKDDFAVRRVRLHCRERALPFAHFLLPPDADQDRKGREARKNPKKNREGPSGKKVTVTSTKPEIVGEDKPILPSEEEARTKIPETQSHELAKKQIQASPSHAGFLSGTKASITPKDKEIWDRLKVSGETRKQLLQQALFCPTLPGKTSEAIWALDDSVVLSSVAEGMWAQSDFCKAVLPKAIVQDACADAQRQQPSGLDEWHENSEEESDDRLPDLERDDMMVRRFGTFPKSISSLLPASQVAICNSPSKRQRKVAGQSEPKLRQKAEKTERNVSLLCVTPPGHGAPSFISKDQNEQKRDPEREKMGFQNPEKGDVMVRRTEGLSKQAEPCVSQLIPVHFSKQHNREEEFIRTGQQVKSVLATDSVRAEPFCAEIAQSIATQPEYTLEHHRRSVAGLAPEDVLSIVDKNVSDPNVIQPEMQKRLGLSSKQLATQDTDPLQISGCRTPVSDEPESVSMFDMRCPDEGAVNQPHSKARHEKLQIVHHQLKEDEDQWQDRERELHEAYKNASSQEEAYNILQHYIERFTISEAVLERLEMPKLLERSHSAEPNSPSPSKGANPLQYLRQQSLPAPKFTSTFEATITPTSGSDSSTPTGSPSSSRAPGSVAVPLVTPKPYAQPKDTQEILRNFKVEGKITVNGEASNGVEGEPDKECSALLFEPSPSLSANTRFSCANLMAAHMELSSVHNHPNEIESNRGLNSTREPKMLERGEQNGTEASASQKVHIETLEAPKQGEDLLLSLLKKLPETSQGVLQDVPLQDQKAATENRDIPNRSACWTWDPEEERRRQERWQQDQERLLQERYQKEQEKLKKEWEKAQKEVEEEERKYYEENLIDLSYSEEDNKQSKEAKLETLFGEQDGASFSKYKEYQPREEIVRCAVDPATSSSADSFSIRHQTEGFTTGV
ncbi:hypothetical protein Chor_015491 [Crotalus horridus]